MESKTSAEKILAELKSFLKLSQIGIQDSATLPDDVRAYCEGRRDQLAMIADQIAHLENHAA